VVVFCFSKRRCDSLVDSLASLDLTSADDKSDIQVRHLGKKLLQVADVWMSTSCRTTTFVNVTYTASVGVHKRMRCSRQGAAG